MAHMITDTDGAVFHKQSAWHGLGYTVEDAMSPTEAMVKAGLDWTVTKTPGITATGYYNDEDVFTDQFCAIVRDDNKTVLAVQSPDYQIVQNSEVFDLAYTLSDQVKVESAFSMNGGKRLVVLLKGETFNPINHTNDGINKYLALLSSHDGTLALSGLPTSVRIVCNNTLTMALASGKKGMFRVTHNGNIEAKKQAMRDALKRYQSTGKMFEDAVNSMAVYGMNREEIQNFWLDVWAKIEEPVVANPKTEAEYRNYLNATTTIAKWTETFDTERSNLNAPATLWMAANAVTKEIQHRIPARGRKPSADSRAFNNLAGTTQDTTLTVMKTALALV